MKRILQNLLIRIDRLHWLWLGLAAPFLLFPTIDRLPAMLIIPGVWLLHWAIGDQKQFPDTERRTASFSTWPLPASPLNGAVTLIALMVVVSTLATYDIALSLPKISGMVLGLGIYTAFVRGGRRYSGWWLSLFLFLGSGLGIAVLGLFGIQWFVDSEKIGLLNPIVRRIPTVITGLQGAEAGFHPNEVAGALTWVLPVFLTLSVYSLLPHRTRRRRAKEPGSMSAVKMAARLSPGQLWGVRIILWLATLFVGGVFVLTQSRSGYLGMAAACLVLFLVMLPRRGRQLALALLLIAGLVTGMLVSKGGYLQIWDWIAGGQTLGEAVFSTNSIDDRLKIWSRAIDGLQDFPFTGMGMNTFREVVYRLYALPRVNPERDIGHAHNEFLQAGLDLGIPGLIAFIALYIVAFWMTKRIWKLAGSFEPAERKLQRAVVLGLGGGLLAHMLYGMTDAVALGAKPGVLFWMLLGLIASSFMQLETPRQGDREISRSEAVLGST